MKKYRLLLMMLIPALPAAAQQPAGLWQYSKVLPPGTPVLHPAAYRNLNVTEAQLAAFLGTVPANANAPEALLLPGPDGIQRTFYIWETPVMARPLAERYPQIRTFTASAADDHRVTAKIDYSPKGFHAMVADGFNSYFIDPFDSAADGRYIVYYRKDYNGKAFGGAVCAVGDDNNGSIPGTSPLYLTRENLPPLAFRMNGTVKRTYRLALSCTGEYAQAVAGRLATKADVLAKMVTTINRVNSVYERDLAITLQLVGNNDTLIFLNGSTDPFNDGNAAGLLGQNQTITDELIGKSNYDIGHIFGTAGGSASGIGLAYHGICMDGVKAQGVTARRMPMGDAFDIDFVSHEMGHQFGADHTFNSNNSGDCTSNAVQSVAYEPGSGSTIMAYAGICGSENIQSNSDPYFHSASLEQITEYVALNTCASLAVTGNQNAVLPAYTATYAIPYLTPFELTAPAATDATADTLNYCWEERDLGDFGKSILQTRLYGPQFRSFSPTPSRTRIFPAIDSLLKSVYSSRQEKLADTARTFCFRLTERDIYQGFGCFNFPDDSIKLNVIYTGSPFRVLLPNALSNWAGNSTQTVTWNVGHTDQAPISCSAVDIYLSTDGGYTFPTLLAGNTPNDGAEAVTLPNVSTTNMRVKVKAVNNVFFAISHTAPPTGFPTHPIPDAGVSILPLPASGFVEVRFLNQDEVADARVTNSVGQLIWKGRISTREVIDVTNWAKGVYYLRLQNDSTVNITRPILVN